MAGRKKKTVIESSSYSVLEEHCIWLNEYYKSLRKSGFNIENSLWLLASPDSYPEWQKKMTLSDIKEHLENDEDED